MSNLQRARSRVSFPISSTKSGHRPPSDAVKHAVAEFLEQRRLFSFSNALASVSNPSDPDPFGTEANTRRHLKGSRSCWYDYGLQRLLHAGRLLPRRRSVVIGAPAERVGEVGHGQFRVPSPKSLMLRGKH